MRPIKPQIDFQTKPIQMGREYAKNYIFQRLSKALMYYASLWLHPYAEKMHSDWMLVYCCT